MGLLGALTLLVAWMIGWPMVVLALGVPAPIAVLAWVAGVVVLGVLGWRARDPRWRHDPVSRVEARQAARERFEQERLRRARAGESVTARRRDHEAEERAAARVEELLARRRHRGDDEAGDGLAT